MIIFFRNDNFNIEFYRVMSLSSSQVNSRSRVSKEEIEEISQPPKELFQSGYGERYWLRTHGKEDYITFTDNSLLELRKYFESLDETGTGSIGVEQLEDPFIAFGLSENRDEVADLIKRTFLLIVAVDLDGSGTIQFNQFLQIMVSNKKSEKGVPQKVVQNAGSSAISDFFKSKTIFDLELTEGKLDDYDPSMNFRLNVSQYRRKRLLESIMSGDKQKKEKGAKIMQNFKKQVITNN